MVDEISRIDDKLFQIKTVKRVREVSPRPDDRRSGRDTYTESDEVGLFAKEDQLKERKKRQRPGGGDTRDKTNKDEKFTESISRDDHATRHIDIIV